MPCAICDNCQPRTVAHITSIGHRKRLIALFKKIKEGKITDPLSPYYCT
jgi:hypothetical protein